MQEKIEYLLAALRREKMSITKSTDTLGEVCVCKIISNILTILKGTPIQSISPSVRAIDTDTQSN